MSDKPAYTVGSGNVFADLGVTDPDLALAKAQIVRQIESCIASRQLTQRDAAKVLRIDESDLSKLFRGRIRGFSLERLVKMLTQLNLDVDITVHPSEHALQTRSPGRVAVYGTDPSELPLAAASPALRAGVRFD